MPHESKRRADPNPERHAPRQTMQRTTARGAFIMSRLLGRGPVHKGESNCSRDTTGTETAPETLGRRRGDLNARGTQRSAAVHEKSSFGAGALRRGLWLSSERA